MEKTEKNMFLSVGKHRLIFNSLSQGVVYLDENGSILHANPAAHNTLGDDFPEFFRNDGRSRRIEFLDENQQFLSVSELPSNRVLSSGKEVRNFVLGARNTDAEQICWLTMNAVPIKSEQSQTLHVLVTFDDISSIVSAQKKLKTSEHLYKFITDHMLDMVALHDCDGVYKYVSPSVKRLLGYEPEELIGVNPYELFHPDDRESISRTSHYPALEGDSNRVSEYRIRRKDGRYIWFETLTNPILADDGMVVELQTSSREITERKNYESRLQLTNKVFENIIEGVVVTDANGVIEFVNPGFSAITGYSAEEALGKNPSILKSDMHLPDFYQELWNELLAEGHWQGEIWNRKKSGTAYPEYLSINAIRDDSGETVQYAAVFYDMTEVKANQEKVEYQANYDALTGLANRSMILNRLEHAIQLRKRDPRPLALLFIDLDNFKIINDNYGHALGDRFLKEVASLLTSNLRDDDTVARLGGDEFVIVVESMNGVNDPVNMANRILENLSSPIVLDQKELFTSASIGISYFPDDGLTAGDLLKAADMAMYKAKKGGKNTFSIFTAELNEAANKRVALEKKLREAVEKEDFQIVYQPQYLLNSGELCGVEALLRWQDTAGDYIDPEEFIPVAEETSLILPIGEWVLKEACRQYQQWKENSIAPGRLAVNVSWRQFQDDSFVSALETLLKQFNIPPQEIQLEITEKLILHDQEHSVRIMEELSGMGLSLALDDFGSGYSSLKVLKDFPIDVLKIDRSFLASGLKDKKSMAIIRSIIALGHELSLQVIAEGIENEKQLRFLRQGNSDIGQGFHLCKPLPAEELEAELLQQ